MPTLFIALLFGIGVGTFAWTKMVRLTGNANPWSVIAGAAAIGAIAFLVLYSLFAWVFPSV